MSNNTSRRPPAQGLSPDDPVASAPEREVVVERHVVADPATTETERRSSVGPFIAGFLTAVVAGAIGVATFLAVSDSDDDGELELDVPAVELDVD